MSCQGCNVQFGGLGVLWEKKDCQKCHLSFCTRCAPRSTEYGAKVENRNNLSNEEFNNNLFLFVGRQRYCLSCRTLINPNSTFDDLMKLKVKQLQDYLLKKNIAIDECVEKKDLVELISKAKERQESGNFPMNYTNSTHRQDFLESLNARGPEEQTGQNVAAENSTIHLPTESPTQNMRSATSGGAKCTIADERVQLEQLKSLADISALSVRQLKYLLATNRVSFKGATEKEELLNLAKKLWNEKQEDDGTKDKLEDSELCKICMDSRVNCVILECGHMATCLNCAKSLSECPICREYISRIVKTFKS